MQWNHTQKVTRHQCYEILAILQSKKICSESYNFSVNVKQWKKLCEASTVRGRQVAAWFLDGYGLFPALRLKQIGEAIAIGLKPTKVENPTQNNMLFIFD